MKQDIKSALRAGFSFRSWRSKRKFLVIESDDWGAVRMPNSHSLISLPSEFRKYYDSAYYRYDTIANGDDLQSLFEVLDNHRDMKGRSAVFTANCIMANPDFNRIMQSDFKEYYYQSFRDTMREYYEEDVWNIWQVGIQRKLFHPQLHGREHVNVDRWMRLLQEGNEVYRDAFSRGIYAVDFNKGKGKANLTAALDIDLDENILCKRKSLIEAVSIFKECFGYQPLSFIAPSYTWSDSLESTLSECGVRYLQGIRNQKVPRLGEEFSYDYRRHYLGEVNSLGQIYLVRNVFFEPSLLPTKDVLSDSVSRVNWSFRLGLPVIIGSHRVNYIGALDVENRKRNLLLLDRLLTKVRKNWPEVEFITSDQLGEEIRRSKFRVD